MRNYERRFMKMTMFGIILLICIALVAIGLLGLIMSLLGAGIIIFLKLLPIVILIIILKKPIKKLIDKIKK
jgi:hypothetical protein